MQPWLSGISMLGFQLAHSPVCSRMPLRMLLIRNAALPATTVNKQKSAFGSLPLQIVRSTQAMRHGDWWYL